MNKEQIEDADRLSPEQFKEESSAGQGIRTTSQCTSTMQPITYIQQTINEIVDNLELDKFENKRSFIVNENDDNEIAPLRAVNRHRCCSKNPISLHITTDTY